MNLGTQKPRSHSSEATVTDSPSRRDTAERSETGFGWKVKDYVVYPAHGVGQILTIEKQTVAGASLEFVVIYFVHNKMTLRVPTQKVANLGMRKLSDHTAIDHARSTLGRAPYKARGTWSRLAQEYESKINSGDIIALAEVVRDLYRPKANQSYSEQQLYAAALDRLVREVALVQHITEREATDQLEGILSAGRTQTGA